MAILARLAGWLKRHPQRLLALALWLALSAASLKGWLLLAALKRGDPPVWRLYGPDAFIYGGWPLFALLATGLAAAYLAEALNPQPSSLRQTLAWVALLGLAALAIYPLGSKDLFGYAAYAHLYGHYGLNPYTARIVDIGGFRADFFLKNMFWVSHGTPYGPLWTYLAYLDYRLCAWLGLIPLLVSYKLLGLVAHLLVTAAVYRLAERLASGRGPLAAALYGFNPLAVFELVANGHNDGLGILLLLGTFYLALGGSSRAGLAAGGLAIAYKLSAGLVLPFLAWRAYRREGWRASALGLTLAAAAVVALYLPFWQGRAMLAGLETTLGGYLSNSLPILPLFLGYPELAPGVRLLGLLLFLACFFYLLYRSLEEGRPELPLLAGLAFLAYLMLGAQVAHRWYFLWPLALLAACPASAVTRLALLQTALLLLSYVPLLALAGRVIDYYTYLLAWLPTLTLAAAYALRRSPAGEPAGETP